METAEIVVIHKNQKQGTDESTLLSPSSRGPKILVQSSQQMEHRDIQRDAETVSLKEVDLSSAAERFPSDCFEWGGVQIQWVPPASVPVPTRANVICTFQAVNLKTTQTLYASAIGNGERRSKRGNG